MASTFLIVILIVETREQRNEREGTRTANGVEKSVPAGSY